jgi:hypothetical protein
MKKILLGIAALTLATNVPAGQPFEAAKWRNVQTYDVPTLLKQEAALIGKIVAVRFHYRSEKLLHLQPSWYEASIWQHDPKANNGFSALRVTVEKKDVPAFQTITSDFNSMTEVTIYGSVEVDPDNNLTHLRFIGRKRDGPERHRH